VVLGILMLAILRVPRRSRQQAGTAGLVLVVMALFIAGTSPMAAAAPSASPTPAREDTLTIGWNCNSNGAVHPCTTPGYRTGFSDTSSGVITPGNVIYSSLYRFDATMAAVPDLADGPCLPQGDGSVIRCRLVETTFHDGTPVTTDDVAFSFDLQKPPGSLTDVRVVDPWTVDFVLSAVDPTFLTEILPTISIFPRHAIEAAYADWVATTKDLEAADLTALADAIDAETASDPPVCTVRLGQLRELLPQLGVQLYWEDYDDDPCAYLQAASPELRQAATALDATGLDAVMAAFSLFGTSWHTIGAGPYRLVSADAGRVHLEASPGYHAGIAATRYLDFVEAGDGSDLVDGSVDLEQIAFMDPDNATFDATAGENGVRIAIPPGTGFVALQFNARPGRLFSDAVLRRALQLCIDLPRDLETVNPGDDQVPVHGPILPGTWAYDPTLSQPARDVEAARALIEGAGWQLGTDSVYARDGVRLAAQIIVRGDTGDRLQMADLIANQAAACGMDLRSRPTDWDLLFGDGGFFTYPHDIPGTGTPFDLYIGAWGSGLDPADALAPFVTSNIEDPQHPDGQNWTGFADPVIDRLDAAGRATYDQAERTTIYRQAQQELAAQVPYLFLWTNLGHDAVRDAVSTVDGPLDLTALNWAWQPERMVVAAQP
jgi:ABC-type transport system substrate-binding protein